MKRSMHFLPVFGLIAFIFTALLCSCSSTTGSNVHSQHSYPEEFTLSKEVLLDKIKGGWAGQVIGCTYGGPTEFKYNGTMIQDYIPIVWDETRMEWYYNNAPGLYDDIYMDLTFVDVFEKEGLDAPAIFHARAFANAEYMLWHANQAARYNILAGMEPPETGHWENNPHADDIDFQIEADFAGLMNPGMVNSSSEVCDRVGHIMNYGDGWYGGVYVAAMYSLSFYSDNIAFIVSEALRTIPEESQFFQCIRDVIIWHSQFPDDWKRTWFEVEKKWSSDIGCPNGVFIPFNIDAKINAAYIVIGMLYGEGDFSKTVDISTRCGQDSDCNPASSGGILGTILGYDAIPAEWKMGLDKVEDRDFKYTTISLADTYDMSFRQALGMICMNGGKAGGNEVVIPLQEPVAVAFERAFEGHYPVRWIDLGRGGKQLKAEDELVCEFGFEGKGFVLKGSAIKDESMDESEVKLEVYIDGELYEETVMPTHFSKRKHEVAWKYNLPDGPHQVKVVLKDPVKGYGLHLSKVLIYGPEPAV
ncbi:MAG: ADP-ribosylglycohydrolase family protein [Bacteroidetes bacterium]|nr:ADP-ribosylglycohydrolase family protein [Bacteroidota bacterium]